MCDSNVILAWATPAEDGTPHGFDARRADVPLMALWIAPPHVIFSKTIHARRVLKLISQHLNYERFSEHFLCWRRRGITPNSEFSGIAANQTHPMLVIGRLQVIAGVRYVTRERGRA
jgi:hypothetical protein